ncbi:MAG: Putative hydrolase, partial [uncultured Blastococcus sp.]
GSARRLRGPVRAPRHRARRPAAAGRARRRPPHLRRPRRPSGGTGLRRRGGPRNRPARRRLHRQQGGLRAAVRPAVGGRLPGRGPRPAGAVRVPRTRRPGRLLRRGARPGRRRRRARAAGGVRRAAAPARAQLRRARDPRRGGRRARPVHLVHPAGLRALAAHRPPCRAARPPGSAAGLRRRAAGERDPRAGGHDRSDGPGGAGADPGFLLPAVPAQLRGRAARDGRRDAERAGPGAGAGGDGCAAARRPWRSRRRLAAPRAGRHGPAPRRAARGHQQLHPLPRRREPTAHGGRAARLLGRRLGAAM